MDSFPPIERIVPHRAPFLFLDHVDSEFPDGIRCATVMRAEANYARDGRVSSLIAIELMAQCVAAFAGMRQHREGRGTEIGFILACREIRFASPFLPIDSSLIVEAHRKWGDVRFGYFDCQVSDRNGSLASGSLTVAIAPPEPRGVG